jgi:corrinoid protein of di/trimethylamine methyltransferase
LKEISWYWRNKNRQELRTMADDKYLLALKVSVVNLDFDGIVTAAKEAMDAGVNPLTAITEGMAAGMSIVGDRFEKGEYFLAELVVAGAVMNDGMAIINPYITGSETEVREKVVMATVEGDNHDIGKTIVTTLLTANGIDVVDLGIDVPTQKIVDAVKEHEPSILGLSALLTVTMPKMGEVIEALQAAGLRERVKVIVGGTPVTPDFAESIGADYCATDAVEGVEKCVEWVTPKEER